MNSNTKKILSVICAAGAAAVCLVMIYFEIVNGHVPTLVWPAFSAFMFGYAALTRKKTKQDSSDKTK